MGGANSPYLDSLFQLTAFASGVKVGTSSQANFGAGLSVTYNETTNRFDIGATASVVTWAAVKAALAEGGLGINTGTLTTTDATESTLLSVPLADDNVYDVLLFIKALTPGDGIYQYTHVGKITIDGGVVTPNDDASIGTDVNTYSPTIPGAQPATYSGGALNIRVQGAAATSIAWTGFALVL